MLLGSFWSNWSVPNTRAQGLLPGLGERKTRNVDAG